MRFPLIAGLCAIVVTTVATSSDTLALTANEPEVSLPPAPQWKPGKIRRGPDGKLYVEPSPQPSQVGSSPRKSESAPAVPKRTHILPIQKRGTKVTLGWNPSNYHMDGPLQGRVGYRVHMGRSEGNYDSILDAGESTSYTVTGLEPGHTYYFAVTAYDDSGVESGFSNEIAVALEPFPKK